MQQISTSLAAKSAISTSLLREDVRPLALNVATFIWLWSELVCWRWLVRRMTSRVD